MKTKNIKKYQKSFVYSPILGGFLVLKSFGQLSWIKKNYNAGKNLPAIKFIVR